MKAAAKKRWVEALRSGEYKQGTDYLHRADGSMCCLGVLCDLEIDGHWKLDGYRYKIGGKDDYPPDRVLNAVGLSFDLAEELGCMNDSGDGFRAIADYIERNL